MKLKSENQKSFKQPMTSVITNHIQIIPEICGGKPHIIGHRIQVQNVVICYELMGMSPDEIVSKYPNITLADVHAALAYYYDHREEIRQDIEKDESYAQEIQRKTSSLLQQKWNKQDKKKNQFPSLNDFRNSLRLQGVSMSNSILQQREDERY